MTETEKNLADNTDQDGQNQAEAELLAEIDSVGILHDESMYTGNGDRPENDADVQELLQDIEHHTEEDEPVDNDSVIADSLLGDGSDDLDDELNELLKELDDDVEQDADEINQESDTDQSHEEEEGQSSVGDDADLDDELGVEEAEQPEADNSDGEQEESHQDDDQLDQYPNENIADKLKAFVSDHKAQLIAGVVVAALGFPVLWVIGNAMATAASGGDQPQVVQAEYLNDLSALKKPVTVSEPLQKPAQKPIQKPQEPQEQFRQPADTQQPLDYNYSQSAQQVPEISESTVNPPAVATVQPTPEMMAAFNQERQMFEAQMRRIEEQRQKEQELAIQRERASQKRMEELELRLANPSAAQQPATANGTISDSTMIDKNTQAIMKIAERQQRFEQTLNQVGIGLNDLRQTANALRISVDQQSARLDENQKAISSIANSVIELRAASSGRKLPQQIGSAPKSTVKVRPTYRVVSAGHGVAFVQSNKRPGDIVQLKVGDALVGYGRITGIDGYGQIMTTAGRVKTR